jgi:enoyl-CoA hydratase
MSVRAEIDGPITTVVLDRPEARNAVDGEHARLLAEAFRAFDADASQAVAVLYGDHGTFCAGADLKSMDNQIAWPADGPMGPTRMRLGKPVIAAVEGYAVAGGLELALWADLRVVADDATFGVFCRRWGVPLIDGGTIRLPRLIGESRALDLILTGRPVAADEAERIGLANRVVPSGTARRPPRSSRARSLRSLPRPCAATGPHCWTSPVSHSRRLSRSSTPTGSTYSPRPWPAPSASPAVPGGTAPSKAEPLLKAKSAHFGDGGTCQPRPWVHRWETGKISRMQPPLGS